jgi:large subunit ribosomal protein L2
MAVRKLRPVTPGQRYRTAPVFDNITKTEPEKSLLKPNKKSGGRNSSGRMTIRYSGGGHKRKFRIIDFKRSKKDVPANVRAIEYDPNRSARIALLYYADGEKTYIVAPEGLKVGDTVVSGDKIAPEVGNNLPLATIPLGTIVHNIEIRPGKGGAIARSAGSYAQLVAREGKYATLKLPSGEMRMVLTTCTATVGTVSNSDHMIAMNPVDHPMGGGEGRASGGHPRSRTGLYAKGKKTRAKHKYSDKMIISKRK